MSSFEIIVVDDGTDKTAEIANSMGVWVLPGKRQGLGQAIIDGINATSADIVLVMDSDLQHNPRDIPRIVKPIMEQGYDFVIGSKYVRGGDVREWGFFRRMVSTISGYFWYLPLGIRDANSGFFALRKSILDGAVLRPDSWKVMLEVLVRGKWIAKLEVPIKFNKREHGESKNNLRQAMILSWHMVKLMVSKYKGIIKFGIVGTCGAIFHFSLLYILVDVVHLHYIVAAVIAVITTTTLNYTVNHFWTFERRQIKGGWFIGWLKYEAIDEISDVIYIGQLALFVEVFGIWYLLAAMIATGINYPIRYMIFKKMVWGKKRGESKVEGTCESGDFEWRAIWHGNILRRKWKLAIINDISEFFGSEGAGRVLDFGCGSSPTPAFLSHGDYIGVDANADKIAFMKGRRLPECCFYEGDQETLNQFEDGSFDTALCIEVIEHLDWAVGIIPCLGKKLRPGGILVVATPEKESRLWRMVEWWQKKLQPDSHTASHQNLFTENEIDLVCYYNRLKKVRTKHIALGMDRITYYRKVASWR